MLSWKIDKESKIPLYLQLKELIKYYISTGAIRDNDQLPGVIDLSERLEINFETVRKAYKELEKEGLISMKRGKGTFANSPADRPVGRAAMVIKAGEPVEVLKRTLAGLLERGVALDELRAMAERVFDELARERDQPFVIFTECNQLQVREISDVLRANLPVPVRGVLLGDLAKEVAQARDGALLSVITTGFHINEVRKAIGEAPVTVDFVITNMSPETRRRLAEMPRDARYGFVCRDTESIAFYQEMLKSELGISTEIEACTLRETAKLRALLKRADALLVSPPAFEEVKKKAPAGLPVFNVLDRVDPMSVHLIQERLQAA